MSVWLPLASGYGCTRDNPLFEQASAEASGTDPTSGKTTTGPSPPPGTTTGEATGRPPTTTGTVMTTGDVLEACGNGFPGELLISVEATRGEYLPNCDMPVISIRGATISASGTMLEITSCSDCIQGECTTVGPTVSIDLGEQVPGQLAPKQPRCVAVNLLSRLDDADECRFEAFAVRPQENQGLGSPLLMGANGLEFNSAFDFSRPLRIDVEPSGPCDASRTGCDGMLYDMIVGDDQAIVPPGGGLADLEAVKFDGLDYLFRNRMSGRGYSSGRCQDQFSWSASRFL